LRTIIGIGVTNIVKEALASQLLAPVTVTVYVVVVAGLTVMDGVVRPVFHKYDTPPLAVSVAPDPLQIESEVEIICAEGAGSTVTTTDNICEHPLVSVTVTK